MLQGAPLAESHGSRRELHNLQCVWGVCDMLAAPLVVEPPALVFQPTRWRQRWSCDFSPKNALFRLGDGSLLLNFCNLEARLAHYSHQIIKKRENYSNFYEGLLAALRPAGGWKSPPLRPNTWITPAELPTPRPTPLCLKNCLFNVRKQKPRKDIEPERYRANSRQQ